MLFESNTGIMHSTPVPVVFVHGWNSHPGIWNRLSRRLDTLNIPYRKFDHTGMPDSSLEQIAEALGEDIQAFRRMGGYDGPVDIVCHSVGTCIARYYLEVGHGAARREKVRQLIGIGAPNNGSALAELFFNPEHGPKIIEKLNGVFVPPGFDPQTDPLVQGVRPASRTMQELRSAGIRNDITYHMIVTANPYSIPAFFPLFDGKTWESDGDGEYSLTGNGDGIVAHRESALPGVTLDILPADRDDPMDLIPVDQYCHINLLKNPRVIERILEYLTGQ